MLRYIVTILHEEDDGIPVTGAGALVCVDAVTTSAAVLHVRNLAKLNSRKKRCPIQILARTRQRCTHEHIWHAELAVSKNAREWNKPSVR